MSEARIPTNMRTLLILETLAGSDEAMTATEINESIGLPKQTIHRLCKTLEDEGFISRQGASMRYLPARRLRRMGAGVLQNSRVHIARRQILTDLAKDVGETVNYVEPRDGGMSYVDRVETDWPFRVQLPIGTHVPFHCTASGKCFLASMTPRARRRFVSALSLDRMTDATHQAPEALLGELSAIAKRGYSVDAEEFVEGMVAIAVPVRDESDRFAAALAFHGPTQRMSLDSAVERRDILFDASERLRDAMFG